jgi:hypothetical protein
LFYRFKKAKEMKKIAFMFAVATMFVACGSGNKPAEETPADSVVVEEIAEVDTLAADSLAADTVAVDSVM